MKGYKILCAMEYLIGIAAFVYAGVVIWNTCLWLGLAAILFAATALILPAIFMIIGKKISWKFTVSKREIIFPAVLLAFFVILELFEPMSGFLRLIALAIVFELLSKIVLWQAIRAGKITEGQESE